MNEQFLTATLRLAPRAYWRIGQGEESHVEDPNGKPADLLPKLEQRVTWENGEGKAAAAELLVPASSVKGALAHRAAFHANRLAGRWAETMEGELAGYDKSENCPEVRELFGFARDDRDRGNDDPPGRAGRVFLDDGYVEFVNRDLQIMMHNAIDRFTGGVREHFLFSEELVWGKPVEVTLGLDTRGVSDEARRALGFALDDLCRGRLSLGGGAANGHGFFDGAIEWSDGGAWIRGASKGETA